jgi:hypothetical protein
LWRRSLDAVVLLAPGAPDVVTLGGTGPVVWELMADWTGFAALVETLASRYGAPPAQVAADLEPVLADLDAIGAVETAAESGAP